MNYVVMIIGGIVDPTPLVRNFVSQVAKVFPPADANAAVTTKTKVTAAWDKVQALNQIAHNILTQIPDTTLTPPVITNNLANLKTELNKVLDAVQPWKSWWQSLLSWFGYHYVPEERELHFLLNIITSKETSLTKRGTPLWGRISDRVDFRSDAKAKNSVAAKLREGYFRVIGDVKLQSPNLEGGIQSESLRTINEDVGEFIKKFSVPEASIIDANCKQLLVDAQKKLTYAEELSKAIANVKIKRQIPPIVNQIQMKIRGLAKGEELLIPGGYNAKIGTKESGHTIYYSVKREANDQFSFTLINTGEGAKVIDEGTTACDKVLDHLDDKLLLDETFLTNLISQRVEGPNNSMKAVEKIIVDHLAGGNASKCKDGHQYALQANGTCTHHSVMAWLQGVLTDYPIEFRELELFIMQSGMNRLNSIDEKHSWVVKDYSGVLSEKTSLGEEGAQTELKGAALVAKVKEIGKENLQKKTKELETEVEAAEKKAQLRQRRLIAIHKRDPNYATTGEKVEAAWKGAMASIGRAWSNLMGRQDQLESVRQKKGLPSFQKVVAGDLAEIARLEKELVDNKAELAKLAQKKAYLQRLKQEI